MSDERILTNRNFEAMLQSIQHRDEQIAELNRRIDHLEGSLAQLRQEIEISLHQIKIIAAGR